MGDMATFLQGLVTVFQPMSVFSVFLGALLGVAVGVMPGLSSVMGMSIMLPLALQMKGTNGIMMLLGIFCGAIYGGSVTACLLNTPGTANSVATALEGYPLSTKYHQPGQTEL